VIKKQYGAYSKEAAAQHGSEIYRTPDGKEVEVTTRSYDPDFSYYLWGDKLSVGEITQWIRQGQPSLILET